MGRVLVTRHLPDRGLDPLVTAGHEIVQRADDTPFTPAELTEAVADVDAVVCLLTDRLDESVFAAAATGRLRVIANVAVGYDNIDMAAAHTRGITVCNTPGVLDDTTADLAVFLMLAAARLTSDAEADLRAGRWVGWGINQYLGHDIHGATLGLVGYGRIARAVARRAVGFGMTVLHHTRHDTGTRGWVADLHHLLGRADIVSLHVPLTEATRHLIGAAELASMQPSAILVNTARGPVVDEGALAAALTAGTIFAAGLDVFENEPKIHPALLAAPRTVLLPHIGSASIATRTRMAQVASVAVVEVLAGRRPTNIIERTN